MTREQWKVVKQKRNFRHSFVIADDLIVAMDKITHISEPKIGVTREKIRYVIQIHMVSGEVIDVDYHIKPKYKVVTKKLMFGFGKEVEVEVPYTTQDYFDDDNVFKNAKADFRKASLWFRQYLFRSKMW